jgi:hypothetical protein
MLVIDHTELFNDGLKSGRRSTSASDPAERPGGQTRCEGFGRNEGRAPANALSDRSPPRRDPILIPST